MRLSSSIAFLARGFLPLIALMLIGAFGVPAFGADVKETPDTKITGATSSSSCSNKHGNSTCSSCLCDETQTSTGSSVINTTALWHTHLATDYASNVSGSSSGCAPCGATSSKAGILPSLNFGRIHNYAFTAQQSSYGPGVFSSYDVSLQLSTVGFPWGNGARRSIRVVDPTSGSFVEGATDYDWTQPDFTGTPLLTRVDSTVDFDWGAGSPGANVPADDFAARWSGTVTAATSQIYTFYTTNNDGVRLFVNGQLIIDQWKNHTSSEYGGAEYSGTIALTAGQAVSIRMEYYEYTYGAVAKLAWSSASTPKAIIPSTALRTATNTPGLNAIFVAPAGAQSGVYRDDDPYGASSFREFKEIRLFTSTGAATADQAQAATAVLYKLNGDVQTFEVFRTDANASTTGRFARLKRWADRNGNAHTFAYAYPITTDPAQAGGDLAKLWMLSTITDAYGRTATITYRSTQVAGRWVVDRMVMPNTATISYTYNTVAPGMLG